MKNHFVGGDYGTRMASMKVSELNVDNDEKIFTFRNSSTGEDLYFKLMSIVPKKYFLKILILMRLQFILISSCEMIIY